MANFFNMDNNDFLSIPAPWVRDNFGEHVFRGSSKCEVQ
jgi:hypothetical protein